MQTFLSEPTFAASAAALDPKRLNKQLLEGRQLLNALAGNQKGFANHPATNMWRGHEGYFWTYLSGIMQECLWRGIEVAANWRAIDDIMLDNPDMAVRIEKPVWWSDPMIQDRIIFTHRANLYLKDPDYYAQYKVDAMVYQDLLAQDPLTVVCCAARRRVPVMKGLQPCQYFGLAM